MEEVNRSREEEEEEFPIIIARVDSACVPTTRLSDDFPRRRRKKRERERESSTKTKRKRGDLLEVSNGNSSEDVLAFIQRTLETERKTLLDFERHHDFTTLCFEDDDRL